MSADNVAFFIAETARFAREMPLAKAKQFLSGCLVLIGDEPQVATLRQAWVNLDDCDRQLELISTPQLRLNLPTQPSAPTDRA